MQFSFNTPFNQQVFIHNLYQRKKMKKSILIITVLSLIATGCSGGSESIVRQDAKVTIYGDSLCSSTEGDPSWARRLNDLPRYDVTDHCINGFRATYPIFSELIVHDESDIFIMTLGVNDATGMMIGEEFAKEHGLTRQTIDDYRSAYRHIIGMASMNGSKIICVLPPLTGAPWVQPMMPQIWDVIIEACSDGIGTIVNAAPSDASDTIHYEEYSDSLMYNIILSELNNI
jgi:hypothetical protein